MQDSNGYIFGSLEAAARFGGRLGLRQQANLSEEQGPRAGAFEHELEQMADPQPSPAAPPRNDTTVTQWGRCGLVERPER